MISQIRVPDRAIVRQAEELARGVSVSRLTLPGRIDQLLNAHVRWTIHGSGPLAKTYSGRAAFIREAVQPFAARLMRPVAPTIRHMVAQGDVVIVVWHGESTARDGVPYKNDYVWVFKLRDEKAVEVEAFLDLVPYYDVLNRVPLPPEQQR